MKNKGDESGSSTQLDRNKNNSKSKMPGHIKKTSGPDPDPSPWLEVKYELKMKNKAKPYDPKKSVWVPNKADGGYLEGLIESKDGAKVTVKVNGEMKVFKEDQICQVNPGNYDCAEDMANLTYLGDACVLWNSVVRYKNELIYTYSGLFCIAINPYKRYPIYTLRTMELYVGKRRNECWPHIFAIAEGAYQGMANTGDNQSILITGESGAGKTENTKKVISYFATICSSGKRKEGEASLEDKSLIQMRDSKFFSKMKKTHSPLYSNTSTLRMLVFTPVLLTLPEERLLAAQSSLWRALFPKC